jgi:hypothetical protein
MLGLPDYVNQDNSTEDTGLGNEDKNDDRSTQCDIEDVYYEYMMK